MPRSWNDSWLQKSQKTLQRGHWDFPDLSSGHFLQWLFWGAFASFFQKKRNCSTYQPRSMFHQMLWHSSAQWHRVPGFGGPPHLCSRAGHEDCCWKCNWNTQPAEQQAPRHGKNTPTPVPQVGHNCLSLQLNSATAFPIFQLQRSPPIPYNRTKDTQTFYLTEQPVRSWKDTSMSQHTTAIS